MGFHAPMILDTGADETCFPGSMAESFGHNNEHPDVKIEKDAVKGIGGMSDSFIHSIEVSLLDPKKSSAKKMVVAWSSGLEKTPFIEKMECPYGLIGMDIISRWKKLSFIPNKKGLGIYITI